MKKSIALAATMAIAYSDSDYARLKKWMHEFYVDGLAINSQPGKHDAPPSDGLIIRKVEQIMRENGCPCFRPPPVYIPCPQYPVSYQQPASYAQPPCPYQQPMPYQQPPRQLQPMQNSQIEQPVYPQSEQYQEAMPNQASRPSRSYTNEQLLDVLNGLKRARAQQ